MVYTVRDDIAPFATPKRSSSTIGKRCEDPSELWTALRTRSIIHVQEVLAEDPEAAWMPLMEHRWEPPLCAAIQFHCAHEIVRLLLENRSDANQCNVEGQSALIMLCEQAQQFRQASPHTQIHTATSCDPPGCLKCQQSHLLTLGYQRPDDMLELFDSIGRVQEESLLKAAGQLLKFGHTCGVPNISTHICHNRLADCAGSSKLMWLLRDWPDIVTCGVLLCTLKQHRRNQSGESCLELCHLELNHECWHKVIGYVICSVTFNDAGLCFDFF